MRSRATNILTGKHNYRVRPILASQTMEDTFSDPCSVAQEGGSELRSSVGDSASADCNISTSSLSNKISMEKEDESITISDILISGECAFNPTTMHESHVPRAVTSRNYIFCYFLTPFANVLPYDYPLAAWKWQLADKNFGC